MPSGEVSAATRKTWVCVSLDAFRTKDALDGAAPAVLFALETTRFAILTWPPSFLGL